MKKYLKIETLIFVILVIILAYRASSGLSIEKMIPNGDVLLTIDLIMIMYISIQSMNYVKLRKYTMNIFSLVKRLFFIDFSAILATNIITTGL